MDTTTDHFTPLALRVRGKKYGNKGELQLPAILCQDACQRLMLHHYITASRTIINIVLSYVEFSHWTRQPCERGFVRYMPSPFYPSRVVLFQLHGGMVSHMQVLATHFSTVYNSIFTSETILVLAACS